MLGTCSGSFPNVTDVHLTVGGVALPPVVQLRKTRGGRPERDARRLRRPLRHQQVIVVDEDVDIHDANEVEWAVSTRFRPTATSS